MARRFSSRKGALGSFSVARSPPRGEPIQKINNTDSSRIENKFPDRARGPFMCIRPRELACVWKPAFLSELKSRSEQYKKKN